MIVTSVAPYAASVVAGATKSDAVCAFHHKQRVNRAKFAKKSQPPKYSASFFTMRREKEHLLSTSNHNSSLFIGRPPQVELYLLSTSNHTPCAITLFVQSVELYLLSTSNHNLCHLHYSLSTSLLLFNWTIRSCLMRCCLLQSY